MKDTLMGRAIGILIADGSDGAAIKKIKKAATDAGASVKIIAPKVGGAKLADGSMLAADGQLAGTPSVLFDAVAVILSDEGAKALSMESAAIDFVRDAFGHLKAIAVDQGGQALLKNANVGQDAGVVDASDKTHSLLRQRRANGTGKSPFEHWHNRIADFVPKESLQREGTDGRYRSPGHCLWS